MLVAVIGSNAQPWRSNRRQISDGYGVPAGPVLTGSGTGTGGGKPSYNGGNAGGSGGGQPSYKPRPSGGNGGSSGGNGGGRPSYKPRPSGGGGNGGLFGIKKPNLGGGLGGFKKPDLGSLFGGFKKPSLPSFGGKPKPSYGAPSGGLGFSKPDLSGIKNVFSGIFGVKKVRNYTEIVFKI